MKFTFGQKARMDRIFEGYEKRIVTDENGKEKVKFVYIKEYFTPQMTKNEYLIIKIMYSVLFLISAACQLYAGLKNVPMNIHYKHMGFAQCVGILALVITAIYIGSKLTAPYEMEIYAYKNSHNKLITASTIAVILIGAVFVTAVVTMFIAGAVSLAHILWALIYLAAAAAVFVIMWLERRTQFTIIPPKNS